MIFDFNIHLYSKANGTLENQIKSDTELSASELKMSFLMNLPKFKEVGIVAGNFMVFNQNILVDPFLDDFISTVKRELPRSCFTLLYDFKLDVKNIEIAKKKKFSFIKFHSYVQQIEESDFERILEVSLKAESLNLGICIDTSYGTTSLFKYDNLKLVAFLTERIKTVPIVLLHSGGSRCIEAMLIADLCENVFLETSLSLKYYQGSTLFNDFNFVYRKIGYNRILFASDFPYQEVNEAIDTFTNFCELNNVDVEDVVKMLNRNAFKLLNILEKS